MWVSVWSFPRVPHPRVEEREVRNYESPNKKTGETVCVFFVLCRACTNFILYKRKNKILETVVLGS